jgi:hypothetical protein
MIEVLVIYIRSEVSRNTELLASESQAVSLSWVANMKESEVWSK